MRGAPPLMLFRIIAGNARAWEKFRAGSLLDRGPLSLRDREIVIDRTCARTGCEYEWGVHVMFFAARAGLTGEQVASLTRGQPTDPCWTAPRDRLLIRAADELHDTSDIVDELWAELAATFDEPQLMDLLLLAGWYHAISYVARATRIPREPGAPAFAL